MLFVANIVFFTYVYVDYIFYMQIFTFMLLFYFNGSFVIFNFGLRGRFRDGLLLGKTLLDFSCFVSHKFVNPKVQYMYLFLVLQVNVLKLYIT